MENISLHVAAVLQQVLVELAEKNDAHAGLLERELEKVEIAMDDAVVAGEPTAELEQLIQMLKTALKSLYKYANK